MKTRHYMFAVTALAAAIGLAACGGGGSSSASYTGTVRGVITGFGSVFVNGVEYDVTGASIMVNGVSGSSENDLKVGDVVSLNGSVNADGKTGTATSVMFENEMEGVVTATTFKTGDTSGTLTVMGQTVNVDASTVFESNVPAITSLDKIAVNNIVEVSGYASSTGTVTATRVEVKASAQAGAEIEVKGVISALDTTAKTFMLGSLKVDYSAIANAPVLANDQYVEVKSITPFDATSTVLIASKIELKDNGLKGHEGRNGEEIKIEALITAAYDSATGSFDIDGKTVLVDQGTEIKGGDTSGLTKDTKVEVHAHYDANGKLVADEIEFGHKGELEFKGFVEDVNPTAGTLTIMGQTIKVDNSTMKEDDTGMGGHSFNLSSISIGDKVEVEAYKDAAGNFVATKITREGNSQSPSFELQGPIDVISGTTLTVNSVNVDVSGVTMLPTGLKQGDVVKVHGNNYSSGTLTAINVSLHS